MARYALYTDDDTPVASTYLSAGNAGTATALQTARTINGVAFDGTANITVAAAGSTLTGTTIANGMLGTTSSKACAGDDARLSDARTPTAHAASHKSAGGDAVKLDELAAPTDVTTLNASTTAHGLMQKYPGGTTNFLRADGAFAAPPGGGGEAFPVGSVFIAVVATNPATLLGYGTWSAFAAGRVLVGLDAGDTDFDLVEETGGAKTHTLTSAEMPAHTHVQDAHNHTQDAHSHVLTQLRDATTGGATTNIALTADTTSTLGTKITGSTTATNQTATATNQNTGGGGAHNNVQPYIVVYMWKRTA